MPIELSVLNTLRTKVRERMNTYADEIAGGSAKDFGEYRNLCGVIHGLALAERDLLDLQNSLERKLDE